MIVLAHVLGWILLGAVAACVIAMFQSNDWDDFAW